MWETQTIPGIDQISDPDLISMDQSPIPIGVLCQKALDENPSRLAPGHVLVFWGKTQVWQKIFLKPMPFSLYESHTNESYICFGVDMGVSHEKIKKLNFENFY